MIFLIIDSEEDMLKTERIYHKHRVLMYNVAYCILKDRYLAEDAVEEAFVRIIKNLDKIDENDDVRTRSYVAMICRNVAKSIYKKRTKENAAEDFPTESYEGFNPAEVVMNREMLNKVSSIIENLSPTYSDVFIMRRVYDLSREQIAESFGINVETVKKRLTRAKLMIVKELQKEAGSGEE